MDYKTARKLFERLDEEKHTGEPGDPPVYLVRLDTYLARGAPPFYGDKVPDYRVRVTLNPETAMLDSVGTLQYVLESAQHFDITHAVLDNSGIALT